MSEAQERWEFEHTLNKFKVPATRRHDGEYLHPDARIGWYMWQERAKLDGTIGVKKPLTPQEQKLSETPPWDSLPDPDTGSHIP